MKNVEVCTKIMLKQVQHRVSINPQQGGDTSNADRHNISPSSYGAITVLRFIVCALK
jgi:hypothetical protein